MFEFYLRFNSKDTGILNYKKYNQNLFKLHPYIPDFPIKIFAYYVLSLYLSSELSSQRNIHSIIHLHYSLSYYLSYLLNFSLLIEKNRSIKFMNLNIYWTINICIKKIVKVKCKNIFFNSLT
jgi:hypothetical protein